ncbi:unnamed protein product [Parascedosporium putredinis]|uniref:Peptidase A1 domain-containing protein n=1 Tax=Parascedosporium putredinis TaxID=1442378 RepID=A0A9P1H3Y5_9PEZI|nr:unnamed protein product [Parascedosporium putredinis]CAI7996169.1 unnamed protein product [Parascedosporium putredinis]
MRSIILAAAAALCASTASAYISLPLTRTNGAISPASSQERRDAADLHIPNLLPANYATNITIGTPPQEFQVFVSVNLKSTWVPSAEGCEDTFKGCDWGYFLTNQSSTYAEGTADYFYDSTTDSTVSGDYFYDTVRVGDLELKDASLGLASSATEMRGVMGLGPARRALSDDPYILLQLADQGLINSLGFSLWADKGSDVRNSNLLLGAVDKARYSGDLQILSTSSYLTSYAGYAVTLASVNISQTAGDISEPIISNLSRYDPYVLIDPSSYVSDLPATLARKIWTRFGAAVERTSGYAIVPCAGIPDAPAELVIGLGEQDEYVLRGNPADKCLFGIQSTASRTGSSSSYDEYYDEGWFLGSSVLGSTYIAFDSVNDQIGLAPLSSDSATATSDIVPFASYGAYLPGSSQANSCPLYSSCSDSGGSRGYGNNGVSGLSIAVLVIIIVAGVAAISVSVCLGIFCCRRRGLCCWKGRRKQDGSPGHIIGPPWPLLCTPAWPWPGLGGTSARRSPQMTTALAVPGAAPTPVLPRTSYADGTLALVNPIARALPRRAAGRCITTDNETTFPMEPEAAGAPVPPTLSVTPPPDEGKGKGKMPVRYA